MFYVGVRTCTGDPRNDNYWGSGSGWKPILKKYPRQEFFKYILQTFSTRYEAEHAERAVIREVYGESPLCMNRQHGIENRSIPGRLRGRILVELKQKCYDALNSEGSFPIQGNPKRIRKKPTRPIANARISKAMKERWKSSPFREKMVKVSRSQARLHGNVLFQIFSMSEQGISSTLISETLGIPQSTVYRVLNGDTHAHLTVELRERRERLHKTQELGRKWEGENANPLNKGNKLLA